MALTLEELEARILDLEDRNDRLEKSVRKGRAFTTNPQAIATDLDDLGSVKTHLDFEEPILSPGDPPADVIRVYAKDSGDVTTLAVRDSAGKFTELSAFGRADNASVDSSQSTASTSYTNLATAGPAVTVVIGASGRAICFINCRMDNDTLDAFSLTAIAVSGSTTVAAADNKSLALQAFVADRDIRAGVSHYFTGLTAGSNTFTMKYRATAGNAKFLDRNLVVIPL